MDSVEKLTGELLEAYSDNNLNKITRNLIGLYKEKEYEKLNLICGMLSEWVEIGINTDGKGFSKIISLYHPDRGEFYRMQISGLASSGNALMLEKFRHILVIQDIEEIAAAIESYEDIDYHPEYVWDANSAGYGFHRNKAHKSRPKQKKHFGGYTFYEAMQIRQYGDTRTKFPTYYFEDMDEVELSESDIADLEGAEYCIHTLIMDLSGNQISDLSPLSGLMQLQELNLANNRLSYIDALSNLQNLKSVDLSGNSVDDVSPLFEIVTLEYADLSGTRVTPAQISELRDLGVVVDV